MNANPKESAEAPLGSSAAVDPSQTPTLRQSLEERPWLWQGKIAPAFWTVASLFSLVLNVVLIVLVILLGRQLFALKDLVAVQLIGGLHENFIKMDEARITAMVPVSDTIPVQFNLPVTTNTTVILTADTRIKGARVNLRTGGLTISDAPANIVLPAGTELPIALSMNVPVDTTIPVQLTVAVDIPLSQTELHEPFVGLQEVVSPYDQLFHSLPASWQETPLCGPLTGWLCK